MEKKNVGYYSNSLEDSFIKLEEREEIETFILQKLSKREIEILELLYGFNGEVMSASEVAETFGVTRTRILQIEQKLLRILATIILTKKKEIIDSETGMTTFDLYEIAKKVADDFIRCNKGSWNYKKRGIIIQSIQDIILWRLSSKERKILLFYSGKHSLFAESDKVKAMLSFAKIEEKINELVLKDALVCEKAKINIKV